MSLLTDFHDAFGAPRVARFPDLLTDRLIADLDLAGHDLIGLDWDSVEFEAQTAHTVYAGPSSGSPAAPAFRVLNASEVGAQPHNEDLDLLTAIGITDTGINLLVMEVPEDHSLILIDQLGNASYMSASEVADFIEGHLDSMGGLNFGTNTPDVYSVNINGDVSFTGDVEIDGGFYSGPHDVSLIATAITQVVLPITGTLVSTDFLNRDTNLGRSDASHFVSSSQKAIKEYVDARTSAIRTQFTVPQQSVLADTVVDLTGQTGTTGYFIAVSGNTPITQFKVADKQEHVLLFEQAPLITASVSIVTKGRRDIQAAAGDYMLIRGTAADVVEIIHYERASGYSIEAFDKILMNFGGQITYETTGGTYFDIGRIIGAGGAFERWTLGNYGPSWLRHDTSIAVNFNIQPLTASRDYTFSNNSGRLIAAFVGAGSPETVVTGSIGDIYLNTSGGASTTLYVKTSGTATATGWTAK